MLTRILGKLLAPTNCWTCRLPGRLKYTHTKLRDLDKTTAGDDIQVKGWVHNFRKQKKYLFIDLKDGSSNEHLQVMVDQKTQPQNLALGYGDAIAVSGKIGTAPRGHLELRAEQLEVKGTCPTNDGFYPFVRKENTTLECIRHHLHLRTHGSQFQTIFRARHLATQAFYQYFNDNGFTHIHTPVLTSNSCEGAGELFLVKPYSDDLMNAMETASDKKPQDEIYFDRKTFLTLSGQMHLEAMCFRLGSVYNFGPVFRAENSNSTIHMSEFYMIEAEEAFVESINDITKRIESAIKTVTNKLLDNHAKEINDAYTKYSADEKKPSENADDRFDWLQKSFPTVTYAEAADILQKQSNFNEKLGLSKSDEFALVKHFGAPIFVIDWPRELKPFYMRTCKHNEQLVEAVDFLMPMVGELAGGSVREDNCDILKESIPSGLEWYLDLRKYGGCSTGGFGIGFDRYLQVVLGITNIKDTIPFPRWPHHCSM